ncbi:hypothetical protein [Paenibacillus pinihumi]|uniref:hypothetical protein n=1 Tax=Paenibacillus pinihumi TaxID=669462 RepID=UPI00040E9E82|nr:hypothetical protein [Paenibacillus pinihumi]
MAVNISVEHIPWQRLTASYARGGEIPGLLERRNYRELANLIEHQSTLWQATPWVIHVLLEQLRQRGAKNVEPDEIGLYLAVASALEGKPLDAGDQVDDPAQLLSESYLWPESDEEDEAAWEEEEPQGYDQASFFSYYYYSYLWLRQARPLLAAIRDNQPEHAESVSRLLKLLQAE